MFALGLHFRRENEKRAAQAAKNRAAALASGGVRMQNQRTAQRVDSTSTAMGARQNQSSHGKSKPSNSTSPRPQTETPSTNMPSRSISAPGAVVPPQMANKRSSSSKPRNPADQQQHLDVCGPKSKDDSVTPVSPSHRVSAAPQLLPTTSPAEATVSVSRASSVKKSSK